MGNCLYVDIKQEKQENIIKGMVDGNMTDRNMVNRDIYVYKPYQPMRSAAIKIPYIKKEKRKRYGLICEECDEIFYSVNTEAKYCTSVCRDKNKKICVNCGKIYYSDLLGNKCSSICKKDDIIIKKICNRCGRTFFASDNITKFCGIQNCYYGTNCIDKVIIWLNYIASTNNIYIQHARNGGEHKDVIDGNIYFFNGYDMNNKTVYEFYTNNGHGNIKLHDSDKIDLRTGKTYGELYNDTIIREQIINKKYKVISIWEDTYDKLFEKN